MFMFVEPDYRQKDVAGKLLFPILFYPGIRCVSVKKKKIYFNEKLVYFFLIFFQLLLLYWMNASNAVYITTKMTLCIVNALENAAHLIALLVTNLVFVWRMYVSVFNVWYIRARIVTIQG